MPTIASDETISSMGRCEVWEGRHGNEDYSRLAVINPVTVRTRPHADSRFAAPSIGGVSRRAGRQ